MNLLPLAVLVFFTACQTDTVRVGEAQFIRTTLPVGAHPTAMASADVDRDGHQDVVTTHRDGNALVLRGDGEGRLARIGSFAAGDNPTDVALADLDADGRVDAVVANHETKYLTILLGDGRGVFRPASNSPLAIDVDPHPHVVRIADLDMDGHVDLVVDHRNGQGLLVLRGRGSGTFESPGKLVACGGDPYLGMAIGDINGDGRLDIITPNPREAGVLLASGSDGISFDQAAPVPASTPFGVELVDLDGDGALDLVAAAGEDSPVIQIFRGDGLGVFSETEDSPVRMAPGAKNIVAGDFNGDGLADVAVSNYVHPDVLLIIGGSPSLATAYLPVGQNPWAMVAVDLNEDGLDDLVIAEESSSDLVVYLSRRD